MQLHKFQSKKVNQTDGLEQDNIRLKERLFNSENQIELMQHEIQSLKQSNKELKRVLARDDAELRFLDHQALGKLHVIALVACPENMLMRVCIL